MFNTYIPCICDEEVEVEYRYYKGFSGSFTEPDEPEEVELLSVKWRGMEIIDVLTKKERSNLETECFEDLEAEKNQAREDQAEAMAFDRWSA